MKDKVCIFTTSHEHIAIVYRDRLEMEGISVTELNKKDSPYGTFGEIELHVDPENVQRALAIIKEINE